MNPLISVIMHKLALSKVALVMLKCGLKPSPLYEYGYCTKICVINRKLKILTVTYFLAKVFSYEVSLCGILSSTL